MTTARKTDDQAPAAEVVIPTPHDVFSDLLSEAQRQLVTAVPTGEGWQLAGLVVSTEEISPEFIDQTTGEKVKRPIPTAILDVTLNESDPLVRFAFMGQVLENAFRRNAIARGDRLAVKMLRKSGRTGVGDYDDWRVVVHKAPQAPQNGPERR